MGLVPNKTYIGKFPTFEAVPESLMKFWLLGLNDGDGTITANYDKNKWHNRIVGNELVCRGVHDFIEKALQIPVSIGIVHKSKVEGGHNTWAITIHGHENLKKYLKWLYSDATIFLKRKYDKYQQFLKMNPEIQ